MIGGFAHAAPYPEAIMNPLPAVLPLYAASMLVLLTLAWAAWLAATHAGWALLLGGLQANAAWLAWQASGLSGRMSRSARWAWSGVILLQFAQAALVCLQAQQGASDLPPAFTLLAGLWSSVAAAAARRRRSP